MSFTELIPEQARIEIEAEARRQGMTVEDWSARVAGARLPSVEQAEALHRERRAKVADVFTAIDGSDGGLTDLEISAVVGVSETTAAWCRVRLVNDGLAEDSGRRIRTSNGLAVVWQLTERGKRALA